MPQDDDARDPGSAVSAAELCDRYVASHHQLRKVVDEEMQAAGLSLARSKLLDQLRREGPMRQQALAACFGFAPRSITDMVDGLERDGLAERLDDPLDRRANLVRLTPTGEAALGAAIKVRSRLIAHIFGGLSAADNAEMVRLISTLDAAVRTAPKPSKNAEERDVVRS